MNTLPRDCLEHLLSFVRSPQFCLVCQLWCDLVHLRHVLVRARTTRDLPSLATIATLCRHVPPTPPCSLSSSTAGAVRCEMGRWVDAKAVKRFLRRVAQRVGLTLSDLSLHRGWAPTASPALPRILGQLCAIPSLTSLDLVVPCLGAQHSSAIAEELSFSLSQALSLRYLQLDFSDCSLGDTDVSRLAYRLSLLTGLVELYLGLSGNRVSSAGAADLTLSLPRMAGLLRVHIDLRQNLITWSGLEERLHLGSGALFPCGVRRLVYRLGPGLSPGMTIHQSPPWVTLARLTHLDLDFGHCTFGLLEAKVLSCFLVACPMAQTILLSLPHCSLGNDGLFPICQVLRPPPGLPPCLRVLCLDLSVNALLGSGLAPLAGALGALAPSLTTLTLRLDGNLVGDAGVSELCASLQGNPFLASLCLSLGGCNLSWKSGISLCQLVGCLSCLEEAHLWLPNNALADFWLGNAGFPLPASLRRFDLCVRHTGLSMRGAELLLGCLMGQAGRLTQGLLDLSDNSIGPNWLRRVLPDVPGHFTIIL
eukprot:RCo005237